MAVSNDLGLRPYTAASDLSAASNQYKIVKISASSTVDVASAATDKLVGTLYNRPKAGEGASVAVEGRVLCQAGAAVAVGARITANSSGQGIGTTTAQDSYIGVAVTAASNAGEIFEVELQHGTV